MKKTKRKNKKIKKIKNISIIASVGILAILLAITIYFLSPIKTLDIEKNNKLSGVERVEAQASLINIIQSYINSSKGIEDYVNNNNIERLTISDLRDNFSIDIHEFENSKYECDINGTSINFEDNYDKQTILLACKAFLLD